MPQLTFNPGLTLAGFRTTRPGTPANIVQILEVKSSGRVVNFTWRYYVYGFWLMFLEFHVHRSEALTWVWISIFNQSLLSIFAGGHLGIEGK